MAMSVAQTLIADVQLTLLIQTSLICAYKNLQLMRPDFVMVVEAITQISVLF